MSDIIVVVRNHQGISMASVDGDLIVVLLASEGQVVKYFYKENERQLLRIELLERRLDV